jgi:hypothetical protein
MIPSERLSALEPLGLTPRQTRFVITVALHGGYCLRRQYLQFTGLRYGKNVRDFLDGLVDRHLAERFCYQPNRGYVYHLRAKSLYRRLHQEDNRNRRHVSAALIARKLMVLDYVLSVPGHNWYATEEDKVAFFTRELTVHLSDLPQPAFHARRSDDGTVRYFIHKLPIYLTSEPRVVHFVYLATDATGRAFEQFLDDHVRLLTQLPAWAVVAVCSNRLSGLRMCRTVFDRFIAKVSRPVAGQDVADLQWFLAAAQKVDRNDMRDLQVADLDRFRDLRERFAGPKFKALYSEWCRRKRRLPARERLPRTVDHPRSAIVVQPIRFAAGSRVMGPAARGAGSPGIGPSVGPGTGPNCIEALKKLRRSTAGSRASYELAVTAIATANSAGAWATHRGKGEGGATPPWRAGATQRVAALAPPVESLPPRRRSVSGRASAPPRARPVAQLASRRSSRTRSTERKARMPQHVDVNEQCLTVAEVGERLHVKDDTVRRLFMNEPGVSVICFPHKGRRLYRTLRIPVSVYARVVTRLMHVA